MPRIKLSDSQAEALLAQGGKDQGYLSQVEH